MRAFLHAKNQVQDIHPSVLPCLGGVRNRGRTGMNMAVHQHSFILFVKILTILKKIYIFVKNNSK